MKLKFDLEWSFDASLGETEPLRAKLKPVIAEWAGKTYPMLLKRLKDDRLSNNSTAVEIIPSKVSGRPEPVWLVATMCVNRTMRSDCAVGVGATREFAEVLYDSFQSVMEERNNSFIQNG
jgi:hypothetical protein